MCGLVGIALISVFCGFVYNGARFELSSLLCGTTRGGIMLKVVVSFVALVFSCGAIASTEVVEARYNKSCIACHSSGAAGAPKAFNAEAWAPRLEKGMDALLKSTMNGLNAMPPKGLCFDCSEADFKALINYMSTPK